MSLHVEKTKPKGDFVATTCTVLLTALVAVNTIAFDLAPSVSYLAGMLIAASALGMLLFSALLRPRPTGPLVIMVVAIVVLTAINHFLVAEQQFAVLLRYATSLAALFGIYLAQLPDLRRFCSYVGMALIAYAAFVGVSSGAYTYAGTPRLRPYWSGVASSSLLIAAVTVLIALSPFKKATKTLWVAAGLALVVGYGVVTTALMLVLFFGGWWFLRKGWSRFWLYAFGAVATIGGILFRNENSVAGADIETLGVGAVGSGRLDSWLDRFTGFAERDLATMLVGLGPYSDYQTTALWDWEAKNAHSDVVTLLMEFGVLGLGAVLCMGVVLYKRSNDVEKLAIIAIAFGAAASNTTIDRPVASAAWGLALYACRYHAVLPMVGRKRVKQPTAYERQLQRALTTSKRQGQRTRQTI